MTDQVPNLAQALRDSLSPPHTVLWWTDFYEARLAEWSDIQDHMPYLRDTAMIVAKPVIAELGVRHGNSTSALMVGAHWMRGHLTSIDIAPPDVPLIWFQDPRWTFVQCDSVSAQAQAAIPSGLDLLFIDTSHTYEQTLTELRLYAPRVHAGGAILCHDTQWDHGDVSLPAPGGPVTVALDDYTAETGLSWRNIMSAPGFYGLGVIEP